MQKRLFSCILLVALFLQTGLALDVSAKSAVLVEAVGGKVLFERDIHTPRGIASTTKIMTALVVLEHADLDAVVTVKQSCTGIEGSSLYLRPGEQITVRDLLYGLMLQSGNDAAVVLADYVGGDVERFVAMMNETAGRLSLTATHFANPSGLPDAAHYSTAWDMARLTMAAMQHPMFRKIVSTRTYTSGTRVFTNHNRLLRTYEGAEGVKTGFTKSAGRCLVSSASRRGTRLIAVTLDAPDDWNDHAALLDFGFSKVRRVTRAKEGSVAATLPVVGGITSRITVLLSGKLTALVSPEQADQVSVSLELPRFLYAPVEQGKPIGTARLLCGEKVIKTVSLLAAESVPVRAPSGFFARLFRIFSQ